LSISALALAGVSGAEANATSLNNSTEVPPAPNSQPNTNNSWNGTINGHACQDGTYIWKLRFTIKESGDVYEKIGHVNLLK
jgi:hypothetical protein